MLSEGHAAEGFVERTDSVDEAVGIFESALKETVQATKFIDRLRDLIEDLRHAESECASPAGEMVQPPRT